MNKKERSLYSPLFLRIEVRISIICHFTRYELRSDLIVIISVLFSYHLLNLTCFHIILLYTRSEGLLDSGQSLWLWLLSLFVRFLTLKLIFMSYSMKMRYLFLSIFLWRSWSLPCLILKLYSLLLIILKLLSGLVSKAD